jgi:exodeoxyribonuclease-5
VNEMGIILNSGQEKICNEAIDWYRNSSEQVFEIEGPAGSGKSVLIYEILRRLGLNANQYLPMAYTGQASIVMRTRGFNTARSIHSSLYEVVETYDDNINAFYGTPYKKREFKLREFLDPGICLFFIDEGYMVPNYMVKDILSFGKKVLVAGDTRQLPPIGDRPGFLTGTRKVHSLTQLMRQAQDNAIVYLANRACKGLPIHNGNYKNQVLVIDDKEFIPEMIGFADAIACGTNRTRDMMNKYIRQIAGFNTELPNFGERIICRNNNWNLVTPDGIALCNGLSGTVVSQPDVSRYDGKTFKLSFRPDLTNSIFFDIPINYEYFTAPFDEKQRLNQNKRFIEGEIFEYSYCLTTHLMQGSEYNNLIYIEEFMRPQIQNQLNYTAITRAKQKLIYIKKTNKYLYIPGLDKII